MKYFLSLILFLLFFFSKSLSQDSGNNVIHLSKLPPGGILLDKGWKFHTGDNPDWPNPDYDDRDWEKIEPTLDLHYLPQIKKEPVGWFRVKLHVDSSLLNKPLAFQVDQSIASEIYLNGKLLKRYGVVSFNSKRVKAVQPLNEPVGFVFQEARQVLAVRFSVQPNLPYLKFVFPYTAFKLRMNDVDGAGRFNRVGNKFPVLNAIYTGIFIVLTIIHLGLFLVFRKQKANLFFSIATLSGAIANGLFIHILNVHNIAYRAYAVIVNWMFLLTFFNLFLFIAVHHLFSRKRNVYFWFIVGYSLASIALWWGFYETGELLAFMLPFVISMIASLRTAWLGYRRGQRDAGIIVAGLAGYLILYSIFVLFYYGFISNLEIGFGDSFTLTDAVYQVAVLSVPMVLSFYLARDFAFTSKELENKLSEVQQLASEKQQILISQKQILEQQVAERTAELKQSLTDLKSTQSQLIQSEKMASLGELTAGIAHEIQNPLNFINNFSELSVELLEETKENIKAEKKEEAIETVDAAQENLQKVIYHGKRADSIVKNMLQHSRSSTGTKELTDINALAEEYLRLAYHGLRAKDNAFNVILTTSLDDSIGKIEVIPQDIGRVLLNLYNNAFYAVNEKKKRVDESFEPTVTVTTKRTASRAEICIWDNGTGVPQKVLDKIFQPFFTTKPTGEGIGLGLSLSYDIITKGHGGELKVNTKEGEWAEFNIELPLPENISGSNGSTYAG